MVYADSLNDCVADTLKLLPRDVQEKFTYDSNQKMLIESRPQIGLKIAHIPANSFVYFTNNNTFECHPKLRDLNELQTIGLYSFIINTLELKTLQPVVQNLEGNQLSLTPPSIPTSCLNEPRLKNILATKYCEYLNYNLLNKIPKWLDGNNSSSLERLCNNQSQKQQAVNINYVKPSANSFARRCLDQIYSSNEQYQYSGEHQFLSENIDGSQWVYVSSGASASYISANQISPLACVSKAQNPDRSIASRLITRIENKISSYTPSQKANYFNSIATPCRRANLDQDFENYINRNISSSGTSRGSQRLD